MIYVESRNRLHEILIISINIADRLNTKVDNWNTITNVVPSKVETNSLSEIIA